MVGLSERTWVPKNPLGAYDFSAAAGGGSVLMDGVHSITGDLASDMTINKPDVQVVDVYGNALKRGKEVSVSRGGFCVANLNLIRECAANLFWVGGL